MGEDGAEGLRERYDRLREVNVMAQIGRPKLVETIHTEFRRCRSCGCEYMYRIDARGHITHATCPRCHARDAESLKVYPRVY